MTSGRSGEAKFKQFVIAKGWAPTHTTLRAASATTSFAPARGFAAQYRPCPSNEIANARRVSLILTTAASAPGNTAVLVRTM